MKNELNSKQQSAVVTIEGPLLIIAGAGSGKTRTLIERIANIILSKRAFPSEIMAVTFTNKAAKELKERIVYRVGEIGKAVFAGTFHSISARILRKYADRLGYNSNFVIYDTEDKEKVVKGMIKKNNFNNSSFPHKKISTLISILKNKLIYPENYNSDTDEYFYDKIKDIYSDYQRELEKCNAFDFDDLICMTVKLFQKNEDVLFEYQNRIKYICVDEYQDTNFVQDEFVTLLSKIYKNVCVVGDEDQSIYSWRGADINNILTFKDRHKNCAMIQLEQNYRSSANILKTANSIISKNIQRLGKNLFTESDSGEKIKLISCLSDIKEGNIVIDEIVNTVNEGSELNEICVLYRTNSQSRIIEENLRKKGLPYSIFGGLKFYERKEIKDITAYLRLLINSDDNVSFERILNFPPRGIGKKTLEKIKSKAIQTGLSYFQVLKSSDIFHSDSKSNNKISEFIELIETTAIEMIKFNAQKTAEFIFNKSGLEEFYLKQSDSSDDSSRIDNLYEFLNGVSEFVKSEENNTLIDFLTSAALLADIDSYNEKEDNIVLMTVHSAKGLEFDNVFIIGLNEGLFPFIHAGEPLKIEEERRLFYVAVTRARKKLFISTYRSRNRYFGNNGEYLPSRFLDDLPENSIDKSRYKKYDDDQLKFDRISKYQRSEFNIEKELTFNKKDLVLSKQFGEGSVLNIEVLNNKQVITVDFDDFGIKKLLVRYADLKKL